MKVRSLRSQMLFLALFFLLAHLCFAEESLILGDYSEQNPQKIIEQAYKDAKWDDLSIEIRQVKLEPQEGFAPMKLKNPAMNEKVYYVSSTVDFNLKDVTAVDVFYKPRMEGNLGVNIYLKKDALARFKDYSNKHIKEFVGIIVNGELRNIIKIMEPIETNKLGIGEFSVTEAMDIVNKFFKPFKPVWHYFN